jgi:Zn-dependent peptidase ImmA (M78 family)/transcriptional regulator with XRE-family HTH domain
MQTNIPKRLKAAREEAGLTQQRFSDALGFKDRQTLAAIEAGIRKISAEELMKAMQVLGKDLEYFTDPFRLDGEGSFSWRVNPGAEESLRDFESRASSWLALYRHLAQDNAPRTSPLHLSLTPRSSYQDAHHAADWLAREWELGDVPATTLEYAITSRHRALVLHVDAPHGVSGAAFRLPQFSAILINRKEPPGRLYYDLAHHLFHLLTWETIPPAHTQRPMPNPIVRKAAHPEQLANTFASALLMPEPIIRAWPAMPNDTAQRNTWLNHHAHHLHVSTPALQHRLVHLGLMNKSDVDNTLDWPRERETQSPRPFSEDFVRTLARGIEAGKVSTRRAAAMLGMTIEELGELFRAHEVDVSFDI